MTHTLCAADVRAATGWGAHRTRTALKSPHALSFKKAPSGAKGGARKKLFRLSDVLERLWRIRTFSEQMAQALIETDQRIRDGMKEVNL